MVSLRLRRDAALFMCALGVEEPDRLVIYYAQSLTAQRGPRFILMNIESPTLPVHRQLAVRITGAASPEDVSWSGASTPVILARDQEEVNRRGPGAGRGLSRRQSRSHNVGMGSLYASRRSSSCDPLLAVLPHAAFVFAREKAVAGRRTRGGRRRSRADGSRRRRLSQTGCPSDGRTRSSGGTRVAPRGDLPRKIFAVGPSRAAFTRASRRAPRRASPSPFSSTWPCGALTRDPWRGVLRAEERHASDTRTRRRDEARAPACALAILTTKRSASRETRLRQSSSIARSRLYFASAHRATRTMVLMGPELTATARSAIESSRFSDGARHRPIARRLREMHARGLRDGPTG